MSGLNFKKFDPNYNWYNHPFTNKQLQLIYGEYDPSVRKQEIAVIFKKAEVLGDDDIVETIEEKYSELMFGKRYQPRYTIEEAKQRLQAMTPFEINWTRE